MKTLFFLMIVSTQFNAQQLTSANAKIVVDSYSLEKSRSIPIGVLIELESDWHVYWRNSGDTGIPTSIEFELPEGINISEIHWPIPKIFEFDGLASFGYEKQILLIAELNVSENFKSDSVSITAILKSLICKDVCIPFNTNASQKINLTNAFSAEEEISELFNQTRNNLPETKINFELSVVPDNDSITLIIKKYISKSVDIKSVYFLPYENGMFKNTAEQNFKIKDDGIELIVKYDQFKTSELREMFGILVFHYNDATRSQIAYEIKKQINTNN